MQSLFHESPCGRSWTGLWVQRRIWISADAPIRSATWAAFEPSVKASSRRFEVPPMLPSAELSPFTHSEVNCGSLKEMIQYVHINAQCELFWHPDGIVNHCLAIQS